MPSLKAGDIFSIPLPDSRYLAGRVVLDVAQALKRGLIKPGTPLALKSGSILVETYREISEAPSPAVSEVLLPGVFVSKSLFSPREEGHWRIVGHQPIEPTRIEFPEALYGSKRTVMFTRGEVDLPVPLGLEALDRFETRPGVVPAHALAGTCLYYLGLKHLIRAANPESMDLRDTDLRFTDQRDEIYRLMGEDPKQSYHELSARHGHDISRLYR
jgi:hypothetical protein